MVRRILVVVALGIFVSAQQAAASGQQAEIAAGRHRIAGHVLSALQRAKPTRVAVEAVDADQPLPLTIVLNRDDPAGFDRFLADVYNPLSPHFRHFLSPMEISERFGPSQADYEVVAGYLQEQGFTVTETSPNRMTLVVTGTRGLAEKAFHLHLADYELSGRPFFANDADPELPAVVAPHVESIIGLNDFARPHSETAASPSGPCGINGIVDSDCFDNIMKQLFRLGLLCAVGAIDILLLVILTLLTLPAAGLLAAIINSFAPTLATLLILPTIIACTDLYNTPGPHGGPFAPVKGLNPGVTPATGAGQKIGLVEFDSFHSSDVSDFLKLLRFPPTQIGQLTKVDVNGGAAVGSDEDEVLLDIDEVMMGAPGASVVVYDAPFTGGSSFQAIFNRMINDGVTVISNSWSYCEDQTTLADVQSIDSILATAAAAGISVFNGSGDHGSTCLDGAADTIGVPADSPHATAVGGTTEISGPNLTYGSETWWDGAASTPPTVQGGFGVSKFFSRPPYQNGFTGAAGRSIPDVAFGADPAADGIPICQADKGGCPSGLIYGGTSMTAPIWAGLAARLNQGFGQNLGLLNPSLYPLAASNAFHSPASMGSDFAHVGIGSPNASLLLLALEGEAPGTPDPSTSNVAAFLPAAFADGNFQSTVSVQLKDANGSVVPGKHVSLHANGGSSAVVSAGGVTSVDGGVFVFTVTDPTIENVTLTAHDDDDGFDLAQTVTVLFVAPAATAGSVVASPTPVLADGSAKTTITVTLHDASNNGVPGKTVTLAQGAGRSIITGPTPATTDSNGQIVWTATDTFTESVIYTAVDVTDGNLPVPDTGTSTVSFTSGSGATCPVGQEVPQAGWAVTSPVTGFSLATNCVGASGTAWDPAGNLWVMNYPTGNLYKFPPAGGVASAGTLVGNVGSTTPPVGLPSCPHGLAFSKDGQHLYLARQFCGGGGDVVEISTSDASIVRNLTAADAIHCATGIATDPISGDLFVASPCQAGDDLWRITNPESNSPTLSVYASPGRAIGMNFTPDGTLWTEAYPVENGNHELVKITGTNSANPGTVTILSTSAPGHAGGVLPVLNPAKPGDPSFLFVTDGNTSGGTGILQRVDLTQNPPVFTAVASPNTAAIFVNAGPDGCAYVSNGDRVDRITAADGTCNFATTSTTLTLSLSPVSANPAQGSVQTLVAQFSHLAVPSGTQVSFAVGGANAQASIGKTDVGGTATVSYIGRFAGSDTVVASAIVSGNLFRSNAATISWTPGNHQTFLSLNGCPTSGAAGSPVSLTASLFDLSQNPPVPVAGASIHFSLGGQPCEGVTDGSGVASCSITPSAGGTFSLTVTYAGTGGGAAVPKGFAPALLLDPASASTSFLVIGPQPVEGSPIPTLDPRAMALLGSLLAGAGALAARKMR